MSARNQRPKCRRIQFSLRVLFVVVTVAAIVSCVIVYLRDEYRQAPVFVGVSVRLKDGSVPKHGDVLVSYVRKGRYWQSRVSGFVSGFDANLSLDVPPGNYEVYAWWFPEGLHHARVGGADRITIRASRENRFVATVDDQAAKFERLNTLP